MNAQEHDFGEVEAPPPNLLFDLLTERRVAAARGLRDVQAWAAAYAGMMENGTSDLNDVLLAEEALTASIHRAGEALHCFGVALSCEGVA